METGPQPMERAERLRLAQAIADGVLEVHGEKLKAIGLYGSMARGTDGPYSDIEMFAVLRTQGEEYSREWACGS